MGYVLQQRSTQEHRCAHPVRDYLITIPKGGMLDTSGETVNASMGLFPDGRIGDLWRCDDCRELWRIDMEPPRGAGYVARMPKWYPATPWQRIKYRRK